MKEEIKVPVQWLETLLKDALAVEEANEDYVYENDKNGKFHLKAIGLTGYCKSAKSILEHNERV